MFKIAKNWSRGGFGTRLGFPYDLGSDFGAICGDFGWIWGRLWNDFWIFVEVFRGTNINETYQVEGLASMIRATRGRSIDR